MYQSPQQAICIAYNRLINNRMNFFFCLSKKYDLEFRNLMCSDHGIRALQGGGAG